MWKHLKHVLCSLFVGGGMVICLLAVLLFSYQESYAAEGVYCVVPTGTGGGPFAACEQVFTSIQAAVDTAVGGEEIWVATGVYSDVHSRNDVSQIVYLDKDVTIRGGYAIPFVDQPDPAANPVALDAQQLGRGIYIVTGTTAVLNGLQIRGGSAAGLGGRGVGDDSGGGIFGISATVTLSDSLIFSNTAALDNFGSGGGLTFKDSIVTLTANIVQDNWAGSVGGGAGGGIFLENCRFFLADNEVMGNTAVATATSELIGGFGGGLTLYESGGQLENNLIDGNVAMENGEQAWGGGVYVETSNRLAQTTLQFDANIIRNNFALYHSSPSSDYQLGHGGGLMFYAPDLAGNSHLVVTMTNNVIVQNRAVVTGFSGLGGGLFALNRAGPMTLTLESNTITENVALVNGTETGNFGFGGGLLLANVSASLSGNRFISNTAVISGSLGQGGGIYFHRSQIEQQNTLIQYNAANLTAAGSGGGIFFDLTTATLTNTVVTDNQFADDGAGLAILASDVTLLHPTVARNDGNSAIYMRDPSDAEENIPGELTVNNAVIVSHPVGLDVRNGNTAVVDGVLWYQVPIAVSQGPLATVSLSHQAIGDPRFASDGYHIAPDSAARGRGVLSGVARDIDGEARPFPPALGADEYWLTNLYFPVVDR